MTDARILVVDDEPEIRGALAELLRTDGHRVTVAESGEAALARLADEVYDLALIDLKMPGIGGLEVLATLRQQSPETMAIVLTAYGSLDTAVGALRHGAHDYLFKPCRPAELRESVRAGLRRRERVLQENTLLRQLEGSLAQLKSIRATPPQHDPADEEPPASQPRYLQHGRLLLDTAQHTATLAGRPLPLSPTEFDLLAYLARAAPRAVPAQELVRAVRSYACEPWEAAEIVRCQVYRLRCKARALGAETEVVQTVRGVGYTVAG